MTAKYCATYNNNNYTKLISILKCTFFQPNGYNYTSKESVLLPRNLNQLNDYMCGPLNRNSLVCSECANGFGPSVTSFGYRCVNCTGPWYGKPLCAFIQLFWIIFFTSLTLGTCTRVTVVVLSVCLSVCYHNSCYIPYLQIQFVVLKGSLWHSKCIICVDFSENALFASFGVIC